MATIKQIFKAAKIAMPKDQSGACIHLSPTVPVIVKRTQRVLHADLVYDKNGVYPNTVHVEESGIWHPVADLIVSKTDPDAEATKRVKHRSRNCSCGMCKMFSQQ